MAVAVSVVAAGEAGERVGVEGDAKLNWGSSVVVWDSWVEGSEGHDKP